MHPCIVIPSGARGPTTVGRTGVDFCMFVSKRCGLVGGLGTRRRCVVGTGDNQTDHCCLQTGPSSAVSGVCDRFNFAPDGLRPNTSRGRGVLFNCTASDHIFMRRPCGSGSNA